MTVGQVDQHDQSGAAFDEGADGGAPVLADDEVAFPVAGDGPVLDLGGAVTDEHPVPHHTGSLGPSAGPTLGPAGAQTGGQLLAEGAPALHEP